MNMITNLRERKVVGMYVDAKSEIVAFMFDDHWAAAYKYMPDAGICFGEHTLEEPVIWVVDDRDKEPIELKRTE